MIAPLGTCRGCGAKFRWAKTERGKPIPLDPDPVAGGNIVVTEAGVAHFLRATEMATAPTYVTHFSTCPKSAHFRKPLRSVGTRKGAVS